MRLRIQILLILVFFIPVATLTWLGMKLIATEQEAVQTRMVKVFEEHLRDSETAMLEVLSQEEESISNYFEEIEADKIPLEPDHPLVKQIVVTDSIGSLLYPDVDHVIRSTERIEPSFHRFLSEDREETFGLIDGIISDYKLAVSAQENEFYEKWHHWDKGENSGLFFMKKMESGDIIYAAIDETALKSRLIAALPAKAAEEYALPLCTKLVDENNTVIYRFGSFDPVNKKDLPVMFRSLSSPMERWRFDLYAPTSFINPTEKISNILLISLITIGVMITGFVLLLSKELRRDLREASQRLSFVNQVSHELKTPLTNIRMYAELLEENLDDELQESEKRHLNVIGEESRRLSRLIENVLTFSKEKQKKLNLEPAPGDLIEVVESTVQTFLPALKQAGISEVNIINKLETKTVFDPDGVEQILGNLLSNVEKYASEGEKILIQLNEVNGKHQLTFLDHGPGIPTGKEKMIFEPFQRLENTLAAKSTGTGIGLTIARSLARRMGGDLIYDPKYKGAGACFKLMLNPEKTGP